MKEKYLITGANGFIGTHLVKFLIKQGKSVRCLAGSHGDPSCLQNLGADVIEGDIQDESVLKKAVKGMTIVYHLAAKIRPSHVIYGYGKLAKEYLMVNTVATEKLAMACAQADVNKFVYFSSTEVFGIGVGLKETSCCNPLTEYGKSKYYAEKLLLNLAKRNGFSVMIIRPGLIYGPGNYALLTLFQIIKAGIIPMIGDGSNYLPLCYIDDLIRVTYALQYKSNTADVYNIVERSYRYNELVQAISDSLGIKPFAVRIPRGIVHGASLVKEKFETLIRLQFYPFHLNINSRTMKLYSCDWDCLGLKAVNGSGLRYEFCLKKGIVLTTKWYKKCRLL
jgi:nucleoside-diphosphate-sugar epimerase